ncbi:MAG: hypothetical protein AB1384_07620 [Actinomycetota bacterium]
MDMEPGWPIRALKLWIFAAVVGHTLQAPFAYFAARKRGEDPWRCVYDTLALGAIALIPLLRKPKLADEAGRVNA